MKRRIMAVFFLALCIFAVWRIWLYCDINQRIAKIRAAGLPTSGAEMNQWVAPVPDTSNGAVVMAQAFDLAYVFPDLRSNEVKKAGILIRTNRWSPATRELVSTYVQSNAATLAKAEEAFRLNHFQYPIDYSYGPEAELPHLMKLKNLAWIVSLKNGLDAEGGSSDQWPEDVKLQLKIAGTLEQEPLVISHLVRNAIIQMAVKATERSVNQASPSAEAGKDLQAAFIRAGETNWLPRALVGERAMMMPTFRLSRTEAASFQDNEGQENAPRKPVHYSGKPFFGTWLTGFMERDLDFFLGTMDKGIELAALPPPACFAMTNQIQEASEIARKKFCILSSLYLPSLSKMVVKEAWAQACLELASTALAIERFRLQQGQLPDALNELAPKFIDAVPKDPFDGAPLRYKRLARGYVVYSVDADGHDDGGREPPEQRKSSDTNSYDLTFVVER